GPGAADLRVLHDHLGVVVVHLAAEQLLGGAHHPRAAGEHAVNAVAGVVPQRQPHLAVLAVGPAERPAVELVVLLGGAAEQVDLLGVEETRDQDVTVLVIAGGLLVGQNAWGHGRTSAGVGTVFGSPLLLYACPPGGQASARWRFRREKNVL